MPKGDPWGTFQDHEFPDSKRGQESQSQEAVKQLVELQTQVGAEPFCWVIQEAHGGLTEQLCGTFEQVRDRVIMKFGVIIDVLSVLNESAPRWNLTVRDRRDVYRSVYITALPYREEGIQPRPPKMPDDGVQPMTGPEKEQAIWGRILPDIINPGQIGDHPDRSDL